MQTGDAHQRRRLATPRRPEQGQEGALGDTEGNIVKFVAVKEDITDRKKTETELRKLSKAITQSPVSVVITDTEGAIEYVNPKFCEVTGYTSDETIGQNPRILNARIQPKEYFKNL